MSEVGVGSGDKTAGSSTRNWLIGGLLAVSASIIFGLLYLFVIAPSVPNGSVGWYLFSFATGLTMIVMPCTLPLAFVIVPLSMGKGMIKGISMALSFGLGVAFTLSLYGIAAAVLGGLALGALGADLETLKNWVYFGAGIFALLFALSEIGLMNFHMPTYSGAAPAFIQKRQEILKAFFLGAFLGNVGVGCPHPATPLILIEIATSGDVLYGWTMFLIHAVGRVLPLLLLAFLAILGVNGLNWLMARKDAVERATGWAMVFVAGFILTLGLFSHKWWVNSGIHNGLEAITQESALNSLLNDTLGTAVAHLHGIESGVGLFGLPLAWGSWFLVFLWLFPIWWWYAKRKRQIHNSPAYKITALEAQIDRIERDRRQIESTMNIDELELTHDLKHTQNEIDALEKRRREEESKIQYGETGAFKEPVARAYEVKILGMQRNYLLLVSFFLAVIFIYYLPTNFYLRSTSSTEDHGSAAVQAPEATVTGVAFDTSTANLPLARDPEFVTLQNGDTYEITASYVQKQIGNQRLRMLAYNGSVPGPFIRITQGGQANIVFVNNTDTDQTIHSHGLRLNNNFDGTPGMTQNVVIPGETFTYILDFPDAGIAWYHPHTRDDYGQEMGLYGNYIVDSTEVDYYSTVNREMPLVLDDILIENNRIAPFFKDYVDHALLGRFGNQYLINGEVDYTLNVQKGEVIRFLMTNVSNARTYRLSIPGAHIKRIAADQSKFEMETFDTELLISPAERLVFEVFFQESGTYKLVNRTNTETEEIVRFISSDASVTTSYKDTFLNARKNLPLSQEFANLRAYNDKAPDKKLKLTVSLTNTISHDAHAHSGAAPLPAQSTGSPTEVDHHGGAAGTMDHSTMMGNTSESTDIMHHSTMMENMDGSMSAPTIDSIQWSDPKNSDAQNTTENVEWVIIDEATGKKGMDIPVSDWKFKQGSLVKIRISNDPMAAHVMQHPIHLHGQRFVVLNENGVLNENMAWKDTALVLPGGYIDILVDMSNLGEWMLHCHISEHLHAGMMMPFRVEDQNGYATGDEFRKTLSPSTQSTSDVTTFGDAIPQTRSNNFADSIKNDDKIAVESQIIKKGVESYLTLSFNDAAGNPLNLDSNITYPLAITFVDKSNTVRFVTYPGNTTFPVPTVPLDTNVPQGNIPGTPGFDESMPHPHSFNIIIIQTAYAHNGVNDGHPNARSYSVPVKFSESGEYRGFVEYLVEGENNPRLGIITVNVVVPSWSVDNYGWSPEKKKWILGIISIILMVPLIIYVRRYINVKN